MISSRKRRKKGQQYHEFVYKEKNNAGAMVIYEQHVYVNEHNMYLLTFGCEEGNYEKYKETGQEIMKSFKLTKNR